MKSAALRKGDRILIPSVGIGVRVHQRMIGLLGRNELGRDRALFLAPASSIHTWFMRFAIDVFFVDRDLRVRKILYDLPPWHMAGARGSWAVVELQAGWLPHNAVSVGDRLSMEPDGSVFSWTGKPSSFPSSEDA